MVVREWGRNIYQQSSGEPPNIWAPVIVPASRRGLTLRAHARLAREYALARMAQRMRERERGECDKVPPRAPHSKQLMMKRHVRRRARASSSSSSYAIPSFTKCLLCSLTLRNISRTVKYTKTETLQRKCWFKVHLKKTLTHTLTQNANV